MDDRYQRIIDALGCDSDAFIELLTIIDDLGLLERVLEYLGLEDVEDTDD